jgi:hypothetical protein
MPEEEAKDEPQERAESPQSASEAPQLGVSELTRAQLEELRRKLQKKFH